MINILYYSGMRTQRLAAEIGIPRTTLDSIIKGKVDPRLSSLVLITKYLGCSIDDLLINWSMIWDQYKMTAMKKMPLDDMERLLAEEHNPFVLCQRTLRYVDYPHRKVLFQYPLYKGD